MYLRYSYVDYVHVLHSAVVTVPEALTLCCAQSKPGGCVSCVVIGGDVLFIAAMNAASADSATQYIEIAQNEKKALISSAPEAKRMGSAHNGRRAGQRGA